MAFRRRSSAPRRKIYTGGGLGVFPNTSMAVMDTGFAGWIKPPAGTEDTIQSVGKWEPENDTLVRTVIRFGFSIANATASFLAIAHFGVIAWNGNSDTDTADFPSPINVGHEWVLRNEVIVASPDAAVDHTMVGFPSDSMLESKAQRKLPERTGLLAVVQVERLAGAYDYFNGAFDIRTWYKQA